ncbi:flagellar hook protein FlgE [Flavimobilis marinus]|uniref:Flagellar hook protein FlgE n=1 Tax=Flavimobilis marinus TaxID=285351 RepID=A0A1I2GNP1_9MICO|nr:flagellar hook protein FlgE [Flavimobilis marinus]GHG55848.1 flagellar hook protein FlgE [Flavimobilis marinus]SFF19082.1 flagellar hook protein FlgE [Flavimobilis marinus]
MLRSLFSGISGLRSHQTMLDVTGNNIANVNTTGFKASQTQFQDTLSQVLTNPGGAQAGIGGTNPAQVGLGVKVAAISTNFQQGAAQTTNRSTDMMISGDGFFSVQKNGQTFYTRNGSFDFDATGQLVTAEGGLVRGWLANAAGQIDTADGLAPIQLPTTTLVGAQATTNVAFGGNLPSDVAVGTNLVRDVEVFDELGASSTLTLAFTRTAAGWNVSGTDGGAPATGTLAFNTDGTLATGGTLAIGGRNVDLSGVTGYAALSTVEVETVNGNQAGSLQSFSINADGTIIGAFSNGTKQDIGRIALATFANPVGLQKAGGSLYTTSVNSGNPQVGTAGTGGRGSLIGGAVEMSNVDLSSEFTNLIIAQRGFQANSRVITTSDELLQELVNLKR